MRYNIVDDIKTVCALLEMSEGELSNELGVARSTIHRIVSGRTYPNEKLLSEFYDYAYWNRYRSIRLNQLKVQFAKDSYQNILFHGAKGEITGKINLDHARNDIDFGIGFYLGESYDQASSYIFKDQKSSVYIFDACELKRLKTIEFDVSFDWMIAVCYYRGQIDEYKDSKIVKSIIDKINNCDVIIAPIADNNMYEVMNQFARGLITDVQAKYALSASNLGKQHVLKTKKACEAIKMVDRLYLCGRERFDIEYKNKQEMINAYDKNRLAIEKYRREGKYIEELLNDK